MFRTTPAILTSLGARETRCQELFENHGKVDDGPKLFGKCVIAFWRASGTQNNIFIACWEEPMTKCSQCAALLDTTSDRIGSRSGPSLTTCLAAYH